METRIRAGGLNMGAWLLLAVALGDPVAIPASEALASYRIDRFEVSIAQFEAFADGGGYANPERWTEAGRAWLQTHPEGAGALVRAAGRSSGHPVVGVTRFEAEAYCASQGGRLPTGEEWGRAVCAAGGGPYPWGEGVKREVRWFAEGKYGRIESVATAPVESGPENASPFGLVHGAGNVWEWTADSFGESGSLRGGSFMNLPSYCTCRHEERVRVDEARLTAGFRCAWP
jgi:formylglycine-generating enzyme required for sulfatase activity